MKFTPELIERIKSNDPQLTSLDLEYDKIESPEQGAELAAALKSNTTLTHINLGKNFLGDEVIIEIIKSQENNPKLISLNLVNNAITDKGCEVIASMIETNKTLASLDLKNNIIQAKGTELIINALKYNAALSFIRFHGNVIDDKNMEKLSAVVKNNKNILNEDITGPMHLALNMKDPRPSYMARDSIMQPIKGYISRNIEEANKIAKALIEGKIPSGTISLEDLQERASAVKSVLVSEFKMTDLDAANLVKKALASDLAAEVASAPITNNSVGRADKLSSVAQVGLMDNDHPAITSLVSFSSSKVAELSKDKPNNNDRNR